VPSRRGGVGGFERGRFRFDVLLSDGDVDIVNLSSANVDRTVKAAQSVEKSLQDTQAAFFQRTVENWRVPR
jgi:hypothetical protein